MGKWRHKDPEKLPYVGHADYSAGKSRFVQGCAVWFWNPRPKVFDLVGNMEVLFHIPQLLIGNVPYPLIFRFVLSNPLTSGTSSSGSGIPSTKAWSLGAHLLAWIPCHPGLHTCHPPRPQLLLGVMVCSIHRQHDNIVQSAVGSECLNKKS